MSGDDGLRDLWRAQPTKEVTMSTEELRERSARLSRVATRRNWRETFAGLLGIVAVAFVALRGPDAWMMRVGAVVLVLGQAIVLVTLWRRGVPRSAPPVTAPLADRLAHYRAELVRERDLLGSVGRWYLAPIVPGILLVYLGAILWIAPHAPPAWTWLNIAVMLAVTALVFGLIARANLRASEKLAREIDALDAGGGR